MTKIAIIGGGAAGMYASVFLAEKGHEVHVFEKNEKLGKKLFITGVQMPSPEMVLRQILYQSHLPASDPTSSIR